MTPQLRQETENLVKSWVGLDRAMIGEYLVTGFQNPRINLQSVLTRHALIRELFGRKFDDVMEAEIRFAIQVHQTLIEERDRFEATASEEMKQQRRYLRWKAMERALPPEKWDEFLNRWKSLLAAERVPASGRLEVLELACGSANDYRFLEAYGLAPFLAYTGLDLNEANIENAKRMFPQADFRVGNALAIDAPDGAFDFLIVFDLLEHLSIAGMESAIREMSRVTRHELLVTFFNMKAMAEHTVNPVDHYHFNTLSRDRTKALFEAAGGTVEVIGIDGFLAERYGYSGYFNKNSHTFVVRRERRAQAPGKRP